MAAAGSSKHPLRTRTRPQTLATDSAPLRLVDLFAGCGGLTLGTEVAAAQLGRRLDIRLAVDFEESATDVYRANFRHAHDVRTTPVEDLLRPYDAPRLSAAEKRLAAAVGEIDILTGGPPCQGHSNLNNHTRRNDPKNALYLYMVRAAQVVRPTTVLIENVPAVQHDTYNGTNVVETAHLELKKLGYEVDQAVIRLVDLGVAQNRKRHLLLATRRGMPTPSSVFEAIKKNPVPRRDLKWAIGDLANDEGTGFDAPPRASATNQARMQYLIDKKIHDLPNPERPVCHQGNHTYTSMYGRLKWDEPAQTLTSGFGSIGQGRYMHPSLKRALTAHEAARIQGFPDYFDFGSTAKRTQLATMIGNAVPPQLAQRVITLLYSTAGSESLEP